MGELRKDDGLLPTMIGVCRDITEQRRLHAQLIRSEATLAQAQRIARLASWRWDLRSGNESWSNEILEILGFDRTDGAMTFRRLLEFVHPDDRSAVSAAFNSTLAGAAPYALDFRVFDNNGRMRYIHSLGEAIRDPDGSTTSVIGILQDITERKLIEEELAASRDELRNLTDYLQHLQEDERRRIAREIHDEFGAVFTAANLSLYRLASLFQQAPPAARELLASTKEMIANAGKALDDIVNGLHPQMLTHLGLVATMHWYLDEFARRTGLQCTRNLPHEDLVLDEKLTLTLFRCLQESLTNVAKHAQAKNVHVEFAVRAKQLTLTTSDDGCGVAPSALSAADVFGIRGLQERVARLGGTLRMVDNRPRGTRVSVTLPTNAR
jgi:PAS domain S-box-containing protein